MRSVVPVCAFLATATLAIVLAAQAQLACTRELTIAMPGMAMSAAGGALALCPVVLVLGIAAVLLSANACALLVADPHRALTARTLVRRYARLPFGGTAATALTLGSGAVGVMMRLDGTTPAGDTGWLLLAAIVIAVALAATVIALGAMRALAALTRRIVIALGAERHRMRRAATVTAWTQRTRVALAGYGIPPLAARRGLRAPPHVVR